MPDYRRTRDYQPDLQEDLDAQLQGLRRWDPLSGALADRGMDPAYSDRYLASEGSKDTLGSLAEALQNAQSRTESIDAGLGRQQDLIQEQKQNLNPLFAQAQQQEQSSGFMDRLSEGLGSIGGAVSSGLGALVPSQNTLDSIGMRLQNMGAAYHGIVPPYLQQAKIMHEMGQADEMMQMRREQAAQQLQQQRMAQQEKDEQQALGIWKDPNLPLSMKKKISEQLKAKGNALAGNLARLGDEQLIAEMETLQPFLPAGKLGEIVNIMRQPNADLAPVEQWRDFARDRKKAYGEAQMKSERFTGLLQKYQNGEIDINSPEYDEFKQHVMDREKRQQEAAEMDLKLQTLGLSKKKAEQELAVNSVMPQYGPEVHTMGGNVERDRYDPQTGQITKVTGNKPPASVNNVIMKQASAFENKIGDLQALSIVGEKGSLPKAREAVDQIQTLHQARKLLDSGVITGVGAEYRTKFGQALQDIGFKKSDDKIANTQAFAALMASSVGQMIKQFGAGTGLSDADREFAKQMAGGDITADEKAIRKIMDITEKVSRDAIKKHNKTVSKIDSIIPLTVDEPPEYVSPKKQATQIQPQKGPYSDPDKEKRYQEWKRSQGK